MIRGARINTLTAFTASSDTDGHGISDNNEYLADTNPINPNDKLRITSITHGTPTPSYVGSPWLDFFVPPYPGADNVGFDEFTDQHYYRVRAFRPLSP